MILRFCCISVFCLTLFACGSPEKNTDEPTAAEPSAQAEASTAEANKKTIVFFGNSITAGYGLANVSSGYVSLIQQRLDSLRLPYQTVNAGLSGETSAGGNERVDWVIKKPVDIFVLELGGNDALRGLQPDETYKNLGSIIEKVKAKYPSAKVVLAGMQAPPNMGQTYTKQFREMYTRLAKEHNTALIPFILEGVGGIPELNQGDRIHPNEQGQVIMRETVWKVLGPLVGAG